MREGWAILPFEKSIQKVKYTTKIPSSEYLPAGEYPIVSQEESLISGYWNNSEDVFHHSKPVVIFGDHTRIVKYVDFDFVLGADGVKILLPVDGLSAKFLSYYLRWYKVPSLGYSRHFKLLKEAFVPVPPIQEQEKIVAELDCLIGIIEKKKHQLEELDNLAQAIFYDMFGCSLHNVPLSHYAKSLHSGKSLAGDEECCNKVLKTGAVSYDYFRGEETKNLPTDYIPLPEHKVQPKDILVSRMNTLELVGATAFVWNVAENIYLPDRLWKVDLRDNANPVFIWKALIQPPAKEYIRKNAGGTSGSMKNISKPVFLQTPVPFVDLTTQAVFAKKIEAIEKQKELVKQSIVEAETLFNSRMDFWFNN